MSAKDLSVTAVIDNSDLVYDSLRYISVITSLILISSIQEKDMNVLLETISKYANEGLSLQKDIVDYLYFNLEKAPKGNANSIYIANATLEEKVENASAITDLMIPLLDSIISVAASLRQDCKECHTGLNPVIVDSAAVEIQRYACIIDDYRKKLCEELDIGNPCKKKSVVS